MKEYEESFIDQEEFIDSVNHGGEVEFEYNAKQYSIVHNKRCVVFHIVGDDENDKYYSNAEELISQMIDGKNLCDIIPDLKITFRSL